MKGFDQLSWNFKNPVSDNQEIFSNDIFEYEKYIKGESTWTPDEITFSEPVVEISYAYYAKDNNIVFDDERGVGDYFEIEIPSNFSDWEEIEVAYKIHADNQQNFTCLELFWKLCKRLEQRELFDHRFFEGFTPAKNNDSRAIKLFYLRLGS